MKKNSSILRAVNSACPMMFFLLMTYIFTSCSKSNSGSTNQGSLNDMDHKLLIDASLSNYDEIDASKLASSQSSNESVKMFGLMIINDHRTSESELGNIADSFRLPIPAAPDSAHKVRINKLNALSGMAFDTTYMRDIINDHQGAISLFQKELNNGQSTRVKQFANKYLPKLQDHLIKADSIMGILQQH
jgi:putative membrane protein